MDVQEYLPYIYTEDDIEPFRKFCLQNCYQRMVVHKGEVFLPPTDDSCVFLNKGCMKVFFSTENGSERLLWFLESGNLIPEGSGHSFCKRVVAAEESEVLYVTFANIYKFVLESQANFALIVAQYQRRQLLCIQGQLKEIEESNTVRILKFLYQSAVLYGKRSEEGVVIDNLPSRSDIASHLGVHRSNVTRYFSQLEKDGVVRKKGTKTLIVRDMGELQELLERELYK